MHFVVFGQKFRCHIYEMSREKKVERKVVLCVAVYRLGRGLERMRREDYWVAWQMLDGTVIDGLPPHPRVRSSLLNLCYQPTPSRHIRVMSQSVVN
jgi:hypothetical protein